MRTLADRRYCQCPDPLLIGKGHAPGIEIGAGTAGAAGAAGRATADLAARVLGAALLFATGFFLAACLDFFVAAFFMTADFLRAGLDFLAASVFFFLVAAFLFAAFFVAGFFFALAIFCLL